MAVVWRCVATEVDGCELGFEIFIERSKAFCTVFVWVG